jgi:rod shape-determining protein MreD
LSALAKLVGIGLALMLGQVLARLLLPAAIRPDLVLIFALAMGLRGGGMQGLILAFGAGFVMDVLSASPLGLFALLCGTACAATRLLDRALYLRAAVPWATYVGCYVVANWALLGAAQRLFAPAGASNWTDLLLRAPGTALATALAAAPLLSVFRRLLSESDREGAWPVLAPSGPRARP